MSFRLHKKPHCPHGQSHLQSREIKFSVKRRLAITYKLNKSSTFAYWDIIYNFDYKKENNIYGIAMAKLNEQMLYDPKEYIENSLEFIRNHDVSVMVFHPGYLDQYILTHSSFTLIRAMECDFLCSSWLKDWLKEYQIELTDFRKVKNA